MSSTAIETIECPICNRDDFSNVIMLIAHIKAHNKTDPEVDISVVAEQDKYVRGMFG